MITYFVLRGIKAIVARNKLATAFQEINHLVYIHSGCRTGMKPCLLSKALNDGLAKLLAAKVTI